MSSLGQLRNNVEQNEGLQQFSHKWVAVLLMWLETENEDDGQQRPRGPGSNLGCFIRGIHGALVYQMKLQYKIMAAPHFHLQSEQPGVFWD